MKREIWRNCPDTEKVEPVKSLLDRGLLNDGRRGWKQIGRCCTTGCEVPEPMGPSETTASPHERFES